MFDMQRFSDFLTKTRKKRALTQEQLSELVGVTHQAVSKWERGEALPEISKLRTLAGALGVQTDDIIANMYSEEDVQRTAGTDNSGAANAQPQSADAEYYALSDKLSVGDVYYLAPRLSAGVLRDAIDTIINTRGTRAAAMLFQYADEDYLRDLAAPLLAKGDTTLIAYADEKLIKREVVNLITRADLSPDRGVLLQLYQKAGEMLVYSKDEAFIDETFTHTVAATGNWNVFKPFIGKFPQDVLVKQGTDYMIRFGTSAFNMWWGLLGRRVIARMFFGYADHFGNNAQAWRDIALYYGNADKQMMESGIKERLEKCDPQVFAPILPHASDQLRQILGEKGVKEQSTKKQNWNGNNMDVGRIVRQALEKSFGGGDYDDFESRLDDLESRLDDIEERLDDLEDSINAFVELEDQIDEVKEAFEGLKDALE